MNIRTYASANGGWLGCTRKRGKGLEAILLSAIEAEAARRGFHEIYLCTASAERLYARGGWKTFDNIIYKTEDSVLMNKIA